MAARQGGCREEDGGVANLEDRLEECSEEYKRTNGSNLARTALLSTTHAHTQLSNCRRCRCQAACSNIGECEPRSSYACCRVALSMAVMQQPFLSTLESPLVPHGRSVRLTEADEGAGSRFRGLPEVSIE